MQQAEIKPFLLSFFHENKCTTDIQDDHLIKVHLTEEMDKALMNRPFYWHYIEKMGAKGDPATLLLNTGEKPGKDSGEWIHYGAPRLRQIFSYVRKKGKFGLFYEKNGNHYAPLPLKPWLCLNGKIIYSCHQKKEELFSVGLSLITGEMLNQIHTALEQWPLSESIQDYSFTLSPLINPFTGYQRIMNQIKEGIYKEDHSWGEDAETKMQNELALLDKFYSDYDSKPEIYEKEKESIINQYRPIISIEIINGGLFYLHNHPLTRLN